MTITRLLLAAFCALAAGIAVENAKATHTCATDMAHCQVHASAGTLR